MAAADEDEVVKRGGVAHGRVYPPAAARARLVFSVARIVLRISGQARRRRRMSRWLLALPVGAALFTSACALPAAAPMASAPADAHQHGHDHGPSADKAPPLYPGLGTYQQKITTASPQAQAYFDQGLRLALQLQSPGGGARVPRGGAPRSDVRHVLLGRGAHAMARTTTARPTRSARTPRCAAVEQARALSARATERERAVIDALVARHGPAPGDRSRGARSRLRRRHARGRAALSRRPRRGDALRRRA